MKHPFILFLSTIVVLSSCTQEIDYNSYEGWKADDGAPGSYLKERPRGVATSYYYALNDSALNSTGNLWYRDSIRFDEQGRLAFRSRTEGAFRTDTRYGYANDGMASESSVYGLPTSKNLGTFEKAVRKRNGDSSFVIQFEKNNQLLYVDTVHFGNDSNVLTIRETGNGHVFAVEDWYRSNHLVKEVSDDAYGKVGRIFHRDAHNALDSIVYSNPLEKEWFINNSQGDPVAHYHLLGIDTVQLERMGYQYDAHGNWTRRLTWQKKLMPPNALMPNTPIRYYSLVVREIDY